MNNQNLNITSITNDQVKFIVNVEQDLYVVDTKFTDESLLDTLPYSDYDREVLYTMEKKVHLHELKMKLQIQRKYYASLNSEQWLTDTIIEAYMMSFVESEKLYVLSSLQASSIAENESTKSAIRKQLAAFNFIAGPVHINKNHWALLFVNLEVSRETIDKVLRNWTCFCKNRGHLKDIKWITASYDHVVQVNQDYVNCGIFVSYFFKNLLVQNMAMLNNTFDVQMFRNEIRLVIEKSSKINKKINNKHLH